MGNGSQQNDQLKTPKEADADMAEVADNENAPAESGGSGSGGSSGSSQQPTKRGSVDSLGSPKGGRDR